MTTSEDAPMMDVTPEADQYYSIRLPLWSLAGIGGFLLGVMLVVGIGLPAGIPTSSLTQ